jgi:tetratricopeptide (TPR) repeat protein
LAAVAVACGTGRQAQWSVPPPGGHALEANAAAPAAGSGGAGDVAAGEASWAERGTRAALDQAIAHWEKAVVAHPGDAVTWGRLARAYSLLADGYLRAQPDLYLAALEKGTAAGERGLVAASPEFKAQVSAGEKIEDAIKVIGKGSIEPAYWYAVNLGRWARVKGLAALLGNKDRVRGVMEHVLALDETFFHGAPHRYFGAYWSLIPVGKDLDKSREHFEKSLRIAPRFAATKVLMAETYAVKKQDRALYARLLEEVVALPDEVVPGAEPETRIEKEKAREHLAKIDELF